MKLTKRLEKIENQIRPAAEPEFYSWGHDIWTEEEKAATLKKDPGCTFFWKTLSSTLPTEEIKRRKTTGESLKNAEMRYIAGRLNGRGKP